MKTINKYSFHRWWKQAIENSSPEYREWIKKEESWLRENIKKNSSILDVGCGFGKDIKLLVDIAKNISGIDYDREAIREARKNLSRFRNVKIFLENAENMHFENNTFDYVICMGNTFGNFGKKELKILKEMKRVTKKKGQIIIGVYSEKALPTRIGVYKKTKAKIKKISKDGAVITTEGLISEQFSKEKLKNIFKKAGLNVEIINLHSLFYICKAAKK